MQYDGPAMFPHFAVVAAKGWKLVRLWGLRDDGTCTCGIPSCDQSAGKHPSGGTAWHHRATSNEDEIYSWLESVTTEHNRVNVGVLLGPSSGIIDVEFDSPEEEEVLREFGLDKIDTPAYTSGRGKHFIFQHESWMPDSAVVYVRKLGVRLGGGKAAHSVLPPSWHRGGKQYKWLPGRSPEDVNPARLPDSFREAVLSSSKKQTSGIVAQARETLREEQKASTGGRHAYLVGVASRLAMQLTRFTPEEQQELTSLLLAVNASYCDPPKTRDEVVKISRDQFAYYREQRVQRKRSQSLATIGLEFDEEARLWTPGNWKLTVVHSDPPEYVLRIPNLDPSKPPYKVVMSGAEWNNPIKAADAIRSQAGDINPLTPCTKTWLLAWGGEAWRDKEGVEYTRESLPSQLHRERENEYPPTEYRAGAILAGILLDYLEGFSKQESDEESAKRARSDGKPKWILNDRKKVWRLVFRWGATFEAATRQRNYRPENKAESKLRAAILEHLGEKSLPSGSHYDEAGKTSNGWKMFEDRHIEALREIAGRSGENQTGEGE